MKNLNHREVTHFLHKLRSTLKIAAILVMARTFGQYVNSVSDCELDYAVYRWRGRCWAFPTTALQGPLYNRWERDPAFVNDKGEVTTP